MSIHVSPEIHLSAIRHEDREAITAHLQDREVSRYTLLIPYPYTLENADTWITIVADDVERNGRATIWAIRDKSGRLIGEVELSPGDRGKEHCAEIGYWLAKPFWGRGIMTAVVRAVVEHGFREHGLLRIIAPIFVVNGASARVLEKAGFHIEAPLLRKQYLRDGQIFDGRLYVLINESGS
ncbi:MAG: GNAT family N-acetyltransferase [Prosthecobacter sp.]